MSGYALIHDSTKLRELIRDNPDLPIVVLAGEEANGGEWAWQYCCSVDCTIDELLDIKTPYDDDRGRVFTDRDEFVEAIEESLYNADNGMTPEEITAVAKREADMYSGCWHKAICIYVDNN